MLLLFLGQFGRKMKSFWIPQEINIDPIFTLSLARKRVGGDGAARVAFCGWFISTGGELQLWCCLSSNNVSIYQYLVTVTWVMLNCEAMWLAGKVLLCASLATGNNPRQTAGVPPIESTLKHHQHHMVCHWLTEKETSWRKVINSFALHTSGYLSGISTPSVDRACYLV